jgi:hypothetical protein
MSEPTEGVDTTNGTAQNEQSATKNPVSKYGWTPHPDLSEEEAASIYVKIPLMVIKGILY